MACVTVPLFSSSCVPNTKPTFHSSHTPLSLRSDQIRAEPVSRPGLSWEADPEVDAREDLYHHGTDDLVPICMRCRFQWRRCSCRRNSRNRDDSLACQRWDLHRRRDWPNPISNSMPTMLTEVDAEIEVVAECKQASRLAHN